MQSRVRMKASDSASLSLEETGVSTTPNVVTSMLAGYGGAHARVLCLPVYFLSRRILFHFHPALNTERNWKGALTFRGRTNYLVTGRAAVLRRTRPQVLCARLY